MLFLVLSPKQRRHFEYDRQEGWTHQNLNLPHLHICFAPRRTQVTNHKVTNPNGSATWQAECQVQDWGLARWEVGGNQGQHVSFTAPIINQVVEISLHVTASFARTHFILLQSQTQSMSTLHTETHTLCVFGLHGAWRVIYLFIFTVKVLCVL